MSRLWQQMVKQRSDLLVERISFFPDEIADFIALKGIDQSDGQRLCF